ncbi:MAG: 16S rRNA (cytidine(1402)-2'-O)-methyltransferase [Oscillospiraceae bacterium]|nr:16S rRNA (cytidine(1402)-2'-O)-methyltransferase [Oscillospiraceae bacterium]
MSGTLYVVGTPIGNLGDMSPRAIETLSQVDFIAAEDTRVTLKLLNRFEIKTPMISYFEHNIRQRSQYIIDRLQSGENCAIVTDAGMPCISDPGEDLVMLCAENDIPVLVVPGPSAVISALAVSGLSTSRFSFEGFLSVNRRSRFEHLNEVKNYKNTLIFYEAPHKLLTTLKDMLEVFGDRKISLARELTKIHEEIKRTTLSSAVEYYTENSPKGEFVLIIEGYVPDETEQISFDEAVLMVKNLVKNGASISDAAKQIAKETGFKKGDLYKSAIE